MRALIAVFIVTMIAPAQEPLRLKLSNIAADAKGKVSVSCSLPGTPLDCDLEPRFHPPMQSVFKLPLALTVLHQTEQGKFTLDQPIRFRPEDRFVPKAYSPLQDEYPNGNVDVPLRKLLEMAVTLSDNVAADILLRLAGGPKAVSEYIGSLGVAGFHLMDGEHALHRDVKLQYRNWFEPRGAVELLRLIADHSPLHAQDNRMLLEWMRAGTLTKRLQLEMPDGVVVAHKSGSSDVDRGVAHATNDIGLIPLPDGRRLAVAVFVTDSRAGDAARDQVIGRIGRAVYDAAIGKE